jgi:23S rRNA (cytosine1962-C5)-methyltransferase
MQCEAMSAHYDDDCFIQEIRPWKHVSLPVDAVRLFHGRGDYYPSENSSLVRKITLDWFPPVFLLTYYATDTLDGTTTIAQYQKRWLDVLTEIPAIDSTVNLVIQIRPCSTCRNQTLTETRLVSGMVPEPHIVTENGAKYQVHLLKGQNHGLFLDMVHGRSWIHTQCKDRLVSDHLTPAKVLNLFSYSCAFSVVALLGGAKEVINIDMSRGALTLGQKNHEWNHLGGNHRARFWCHDIFKSWGKITQQGPYDILIVDPPTFQRQSFVAKKDYGKIIRRIPVLLTPSSHSYAMLCLNAPDLSCQFLLDLVEKEAPELEFVQRLPHPISFPVLDEDRALKILIYRWRSPVGSIV